MIGIADYGMGNLYSVEKAMDVIGLKTAICRTAGELNECSAVILPGVGAFADAIDNLRKSGMDKIIIEKVEANRPVLAICIGMQLLFAASEENGIHQGLGVFPGRIVRFPVGRKIPHMGWNTVEISSQEPMFADIADNSYFYFVHSYYANELAENYVDAYCDYSVRFPAAVRYKNTFALQFHPEKSGKNGLQMLKNFGRVAECL